MYIKLLLLVNDDSILESEAKRVYIDTENKKQEFINKLSQMRYNFLTKKRSGSLGRYFKAYLQKYPVKICYRGRNPLRLYQTNKITESLESNSQKTNLVINMEKSLNMEAIEKNNKSIEQRESKLTEIKSAMNRYMNDRECEMFNQRKSKENSNKVYKNIADVLKIQRNRAWKKAITEKKRIDMESTQKRIETEKHLKNIEDRYNKFM